MNIIHRFLSCSLLAMLAASAWMSPTGTAAAELPITLRHTLAGTETGRLFGMSIAVDGPLTVVGAPNDSTDGLDVGIVRIFDTGTGGLLHTLRNPMQSSGGYFGSSVGVSGKHVVVGAARNSVRGTWSGAAYVYDMASATPTEPAVTLVNPDAAEFVFFGQSAAISGTRVVMGAPNDNTGAINAGSAYGFDLGGETPETPVVTLRNPSPTAGDYFGTSVGISGARVVVGEVWDAPEGIQVGSAHVFDLQSGTPSVPVATLQNPTPELHDYFGQAVAISGTRVVVGAEFDNTGAGRTGSAHVFELGAGNAPTLVATLNDATSGLSGSFGCSVAISGARVVVGARRDGTGAGAAGKVFVYDTGADASAMLVAALSNPKPEMLGQFGQSVGISGPYVVAGAPENDLGVPNSGAAYIFAQGLPLVEEVAVDDAVTSTTGETVLYPLANDRGMVPMGVITSVDHPGVTITGEGRRLIVPAGFAGVFRYTVNGLTSANVTVTQGTPLENWSRWAGMLVDGAGKQAGTVEVTRARGGIVSCVIRSGAARDGVRFRLGGEQNARASVQTDFGRMVVRKVSGTGRLQVSIGGILKGSLRRCVARAGVEQFNIGLAATDPALPGGGFLTAKVKTAGIVAIVGKLPDGRPTRAGASLADNGSFGFYNAVMRTRGEVTVSGECILADLDATDVTGELRWISGDLPEGLHRNAHDTVLVANGCRYEAGVSPLPGGVVAVSFSGGGLPTELFEVGTATNGAVAAMGALRRFYAVTVRGGATSGAFHAAFRHTGLGTTVRGGGVYLPKANTAVGFFKGATEGGRIELTAPQRE